MNMNNSIALIRLGSIFSFVQNYSNASQIFITNGINVSWQVFFYTILFVLSVPLLLWFSAPTLAKLIFNLNNNSSCEQSPLTIENLLSVGIFLFGIHLLPNAVISLLSLLNSIFIPNSNLTTSEVWQYGNAIRVSLVYSITRIIFSLLFILKPKKIATLFKG